MADAFWSRIFAFSASIRALPAAIIIMHIATKSQIEVTLNLAKSSPSFSISCQLLASASRLAFSRSYACCSSRYLSLGRGPSAASCAFETTFTSAL